jgi:hypothetical protein
LVNNKKYPEPKLSKFQGRMYNGMLDYNYDNDVILEKEEKG